MCNKTLIFDHYVINQNIIDFVVKNYIRFRDYFWKIPPQGREHYTLTFHPYIGILNILATALNSAVLSKNRLSAYINKGILKNECPTFLSQVQTNYLKHRKPEFLWNINNVPRTSQELPLIAQTNAMESSFMYCKIIQIEVNSLCYINFFKVFDFYSWLALILACVGVTLVIGFGKWPTTVSALFSFGVSSKLSKS